MKNCPDCMTDENAVGEGVRCAAHEIAYLRSELARIKQAAGQMVYAFDEMTDEDSGLTIGMSPGPQCRVFDAAIEARNGLNKAVAVGKK